jgi:hypothetical protein
MNRYVCGAMVAYATATLVACDSDFTPYNELEGTRVLAIAAEPAMLLPGQDARLSALVTGPTPTYRWRWCPVTLGPNAGHACAIVRDDLELSTSSTAIVAWPSDAESLCAVAAATPAPAESVRLDCTSDRPVIAIQLDVESEAGKVSAVWPLELGRADRPLNRNPILAAVRTGDAMLEDGMRMTTGSVVPLELVASATIAEAGESLKVSWFISGGEIDRNRTGYEPGGDFAALTRNDWTLPTEGGTAELHLVIRDDRGGVGWLSRHLLVEGGAQ